jgi:hypothetical protein
VATVDYSEMADDSPDKLNENIARQVGEWVGENDNKLDIVERIIEFEKNNDKDWDPTTHISVQPAYVGMLKSAPFIDIKLDSNNNTYLRLKDLESTAAALKEIKGMPDKYSKEWFKMQSDGGLEETLQEVEVTDEEIEQIEELTEEENPLEYWSQFIAPSLKFRPRAKKAALIMLTSPEDKHGSKGRINMLIYGPPGTGKTVIKNFLRDEFGAETIDGPRVSKADITYNKNKDEMGQLPKAHKGILVVEESDEMGEGPLGAALTSLGESGEIEIRDMKIPAKVRGVMLGNFETKQEIIDHWSPESLNRFDFVLNFEFLEEDQKDDTLDYHYEYFRKPSPNDDTNIFKKYVKVARSHKPEIKELDEIKEWKRNNVNEIQNIREGISVMNVAWTIARIHLDDVKLEHYKQAFQLVTSDEKTLSQKFGTLGS